MATLALISDPPPQAGEAALEIAGCGYSQRAKRCLTSLIVADI
jgi:hypothetical protein